MASEPPPGLDEKRPARATRRLPSSRVSAPERERLRAVDFPVALRAVLERRALAHEKQSPPRALAFGTLLEAGPTAVCALLRG